MNKNSIVNRKILALFVVCAVSVCLLITSVMWLSKYNGLVFIDKDINANKIHAQYANEQKSSYEELIKQADYVFIGTVQKNIGTRYTDENTFVDSNNNSHHVYNIFTRYQVQVSKKIKGTVDDTIVVEKLGGVDKEISSVHIMENDILPQEGKEYVFFVSNYNNRYKACGENSTIQKTEENARLIEGIARNLQIDTE